jgi:hypothetical protein
MTEEEIKKYVEEKLTNGKGFDPLTILAIISILIQAWRLYQSCKVSKELLKNNIKRNGLASRVFLKRFVYDKLIEKGIPEDVAHSMVEDIKKEVLARD